MCAGKAVLSVSSKKQEICLGVTEQTRVLVFIGEILIYPRAVQSQSRNAGSRLRCGSNSKPKMTETKEEMQERKVAQFIYDPYVWFSRVSCFNALSKSFSWMKECKT